jgi:hypothetical protein
VKIVFVHFGKEIPKYVLNNIRCTTDEFPDVQVVLITDAKVDYIGIPLLQIFPINLDNSLIAKLMVLNHPKNFRNGFWYFTILRFFALEKYMCSHPGEILHIESDVRISNDFPFGKFTDQNLSIAFPLVDSNRGIASTLYIRSLDALQHFLAESLAIIEKDFTSTDMTLLSQYQKKFPERVLILPIGPVEMVTFDFPNLGVIWKSGLVRNIEYFGGYFDGYSFGQFYFGTDPRNSYGISKTRSRVSSRYLSTRSKVLKWGGNRCFPHVKTCTSSLPLYSLHFHSKRPIFFAVKNLRIIYFLRFGGFSPRYRLSLMVFLSLLSKKIGLVKRVA